MANPRKAHPHLYDGTCAYFVKATQVRVWCAQWKASVVMLGELRLGLVRVGIRVWVRLELDLGLGLC